MFFNKSRLIIAKLIHIATVTEVKFLKLRKTTQTSFGAVGAGARAAMVCLGLGLLGAMAPPVARAATDAGALQLQFEREREQVRALPGRSASEAGEPAIAMSPRSGNALFVQGFRFTGNTVLSSEQLSTVLEPYRLRRLAFADIEALTLVLSAHYRAQGYVASVALPAQDVSDGVLGFVVTEAVLGQVLFDGSTPLRTSTQRITAIVENQLREGEIVQTDALSRAVLIASDLPGLGVTSALAQSATPGQTDLVLRVIDKALVSGNFDMDNTGGTSTGAERFSLNLSGNSVLGQGDLWSTNLSASQGSKFARLGLSHPVGYDGLRLGLNASRLDYHVIAAQYSSLDLRGASSVQGVDAVYPLLRAQDRNLYLSAALDDKRFLNYSGTQAVSDYGSRVLTWNLYGNAYDALGGGGASSASVTLGQGHLNLDASATQVTDAQSTQTAGDFRKLRYALSRQQSLGDRWTLWVSAAGQWTDQNLDSSEKFFLGGSTGVRAYPSGEGAGAMGRIANAELRWRWSEQWVLSAFYDTGSVTVNPRNDYQGASALNSYKLDGAGLALLWQGEGGASAKLVWARRLGDNPNPSATGQDQDGTLVRDRLWANAQLAF